MAVSKDVVMGDAEKKSDQGKGGLPEEKADKDTEIKDVKAILLANISILERAVATKEGRLVGKVLRTTAGARRRKWKGEEVSGFLEEALPPASSVRQIVLGSLEGTDAMQTEEAKASDELLPEVEMYCYLIAIMFLVDEKKFEAAATLSTAAIARMAAFNRRTLDILCARIYFYYSWTHECLDKLDTIRHKLLSLHRTATLRHDNIGLETLLNLLLRNYLHYNLYDQAEKLRSKSRKPDQDSHSNQQYCRYLYYLGKIRAVMLEYSEARDCLQQAVRKSPQVALGFRIETLKWLVIVRLLLGEIPDRSLFRSKGYSKPLLPYLELTQAVRAGDLKLFAAATSRHAAAFEKDGTHNMIVRLRHNVIRAGLRNIHLAYSKISLADVATRLGLTEVADTEFIVAKAIRDGGIDATIDHDSGCMLSHAMLDVYTTSEPMSAFHNRICFCLNVHNEAVKAMRYPPDAHKNDLETDEERRERLQQEQELAHHIAEDDDDDLL